MTFKDSEIEVILNPLQFNYINSSILTVASPTIGRKLSVSCALELIIFSMLNIFKKVILALNKWPWAEYYTVISILRIYIDMVCFDSLPWYRWFLLNFSLVRTTIRRNWVNGEFFDSTIRPRPICFDISRVDRLVYSPCMISDFSSSLKAPFRPILHINWLLVRNHANGCRLLTSVQIASNSHLRMPNSDAI